MANNTKKITDLEKSVRISAPKAPDIDTPEVKKGTDDFRRGKGGAYVIVKGEHRVRIPEKADQSEA